MPVLKSEKFTISTKTRGISLVSTIKRYTRISGSAPQAKEPAAVLVLSHGMGFSKEIWEPVLEDLFRLEDSVGTRPGALPIREVWALDFQNHGEAGVRNADIVAKDPDMLNMHEFADALAAFCNSDLLGNLDPEFDKIILAGHSAGSIVTVLATSYFNPPYKIPFSGLILIDTPFFTPDMLDQTTEMYKFIAASTPRRKDIWPSREAAIKEMKEQLPYSEWDPRMFDIYTKYGLQSLPTPYYPDKEGTTLTTHRSSESVIYQSQAIAYYGLYRLNQISAFIPVHLIYGERNDMFTREAQNSLLNAKEGRIFASVTRVRGAGHLVVQQAPLRIAQEIFRILRENPQIDIRHRL
ncbi:hypothetical protein H0H92_007631 [Tricholoma furcatifolium]|nr:hypothetical protein H0H92_007631 [Tricholoma furcatifolium]